MKTALVLEGGGLRGVYTEGVLDALMQVGWRADYVVGVSAGANNGIYYVAGQPGAALGSVLDYVGDRRYLSLENYVRTHSVFGMDFIFHDIPERLAPLDFDRALASPVQFEAGATDVATGRAVYFDKAHLSGHDTTILRASCSMPGFAPMVPYQGGLYLDGGTADPIPLERALAVGCDRFVVVRTRPLAYRKKPERGRRLYTPLFRQYPALVACLNRRHHVYNASVRLCGALASQGRAVVIAPDAHLEMARFEKDRDKLLAAYRQGLADGERALPQIQRLSAPGGAV